MLTPGAFLYSQIAVLNYRCRERLLFLRGADWGEATKEAAESHRLQTPVVLQAVNTSLFTAGYGAHLDLSSPCYSQKPGTAADHNKLVINHKSLNEMTNEFILFFFFTLEE